MRRIARLAVVVVGLAIALGRPAEATATTINFDSLPTDTTYIAQGLLLSSSTGTYAIGSCGAGDVGCLGDPGFAGVITFTFVELGTTSQASTDSISFLMCHVCSFRGSSAQVFDPFGVLLTTIDLNTDEGVANRTFSYSNPNIGSLVVDLGASTDGIESLTFGPISDLDGPTVPEPGTLLLLGAGLAVVAARRRRAGRPV